MNQLADFLVWMQIEEPNMPLDRNEREGYFYHDIVEKMWKAWKVNHMHWTPLAGRISPEKKRSFREDDFPDTLVDRLKGIDTSAMGAQKPSKMEMEAAREIERLRAERDGLVYLFAEWWMNDDWDNSRYFNEAVRRSPALSERMNESYAGIDAAMSTIPDTKGE